MFDHQFEFSCRQLTNIDSETERKWNYGVRSKYIVRPWAVEEVLRVFYALLYSGDIVLYLSIDNDKSYIINKVGVHSVKRVLPAFNVEDMSER